MTDFLTRMAQAALGLRPVARVLTASRYAPGPEAVELPPPTFETREPEAPRDVDVPSRAMPRPAAATRKLPIASPAERRAAVPVVEHAPVVDPIPVAERNRELPATPRAKPVVNRIEMHGVHASPIAARIAEHPATTNIAAMPAAEPHATRTAPRAPEQSIAFSEEVSIAEPHLPEEPIASPQEMPPPIEPAVPAVTVAMQPTRSNPTPARRATPLPLALPLPSRRDEPPNAETSSEPPIVRVTIGRVEVRAAAPPPPPREAPAPPAPRLSLDDYLRTHNGRTR